MIVLNRIDLWDSEVPLYDPSIGQPKPCLEPFLMSGRELNSCVIICPGGGYLEHADYEGEPVARWLNRLGISVFVLYYRLFPYHHPAPLLDAQRAIRLVRLRAEEFNIDPQRIGILGFSAGGHVASTAGTHFDGGKSLSADPVERISSRPDAMILCYPVVTFGEYRHEGSRLALLGSYYPSQELVDMLSNEKHVTSQTPPTFLWHSSEDEAVPVENSLLFAGALSRHKVPFDLHIFSHGMHGGSLAEDNPALSLWTKACAAWLRDSGFLPGSG